MKKLMLIAACAMMVAGAHAQGTINFANFGSGVNAPVTGADGTALAGPQYQAMLYAGADAGSLTAALDNSAPFSAAGYFLGGTRTVNGFTTGATPFIQVRVWDTATGADWASASIKGESNIFQLGSGLGGGATPPPNMVGLQSFQLVPEPSTIALGALGALALAFVGRRRK